MPQNKDSAKFSEFDALRNGRLVAGFADVAKRGVAAPLPELRKRGLRRLLTNEKAGSGPRLGPAGQNLRQVPRFALTLKLETALCANVIEQCKKILEWQKFQA